MPAERRPAERSRKATLLGLALLAVPGFLLGAGAGLLWEDPGLLASYWLGRTEAVAWGPGEEGGALRAAASRELPAVAAAPDPRAPEADPPSDAPAQGATARAGAAPEGRFLVQVGAFGERAGAERLAAALRQKGYEVIVSDEPGAARWRVRVGPLASREEGERAASRLQREEKLPTWILEEAT